MKMEVETNLEAWEYVKNIVRWFNRKWNL